MPLTPNTKYIYENSDGIIYAREFGSDKRIPVGYESSDAYRRALGLEEEELWHKICQLAVTNETLRAEMDRVIMLYHLIVEEQK
jgi:hypothetical protein